MKYLNDPEDFEIINGKKVLKDGKTLRVPAMMRDGTTDRQATQLLRDYRQRVSDGLTNKDRGYTDSGMMHRPGYRAFPASDIVRARDAESRELDELEYLDSKDAELRTAAVAPPNSTQKGWLVSSENQLVPGDTCTVRNLAFKSFVGSKGRVGWFEGELCCIPLAVLAGADPATDAATISDKEQAHIEYLDALQNAWKGKDEDLHEETAASDEDEDDDDEDEDPFEEGAIGEAVERRRRRTVPGDGLTGDALKRHTQKLLDEHNNRMQGLYDQRDFETANAWKTGK